MMHSFCHVCREKRKGGRGERREWLLLSEQYVKIHLQYAGLEGSSGQIDSYSVIKLCNKLIFVVTSNVFVLF
jgi:hypothetical protein